MEYLEQINQVIRKADYYLKTTFFVLAPIYRVEFGPMQDVTVPFFTTLHSTGESIFVLLCNGAIFDADVLLRTLMEGTIKYCYLMSGSQQERLEKYHEYKYMLTEIDMLSDHYKAIETCNILKKFSTNSTKPFELNILEQCEVDRLQSLYTSKIKNQLKKKWSYQTILNNLGQNHPEYQAQLGSISTYALTSHFGHYDWTGLSSRQAQIAHSIDNNSEKMDVGHAMRIIANVLTFEIIRIGEYLRCNKNHPCAVEAIRLLQQANDYTNELIKQGNAIIDSEM